MPYPSSFPSFLNLLPDLRRISNICKHYYIELNIKTDFQKKTDGFEHSNDLLNALLNMYIPELTQVIRFGIVCDRNLHVIPWLSNSWRIFDPKLLGMFESSTGVAIFKKYMKLKIYTTLGYIVSLILLNLGHVFRFRIVSRMC